MYNPKLSDKNYVNRIFNKNMILSPVCQGFFSGASSVRINISRVNPLSIDLPIDNLRDKINDIISISAVIDTE